MADTLWVGTRKGLFKLGRAGSRWEVQQTSFLGVGVTAVLPDGRDGAVYAAVGHGHFGAKLHRSRDSGASWQEVSAPKYPPRPEGLVENDPMRGTPTRWSLEQIWTLEAGGAGEPGLLWCGTLPGGLFRSRDFGGSWELDRALWDRPERLAWFGGGYDYPGIHSILIDPRDPRHAVLGVSCGGAWATEDGGQGWSLRTKGMYAAFMPPERREEGQIQDPHRIVRCAAAPDVLWTQHHNGAFRSVDCGRTWKELQVPPSSFGFAVAAHPKDPLTAWFVPAVKDELRVPVDGKFVVSRTRDGGRSFEVLRQGLPQSHAYDLVYRHSLDVDSSGNRLAMGSTTGSLWTTDDGGDAWSTASHHLPPVFCVRFATA